MIIRRFDRWFQSSAVVLLTIAILVLNTSFKSACWTKPYPDNMSKEIDFCQELQTKDFDEMINHALRDSQYVDSMTIPSDVILSIAISEFGNATKRDSQLYDSLCLQWKYAMHDFINGFGHCGVVRMKQVVEECNNMPGGGLGRCSMVLSCNAGEEEYMFYFFRNNRRTFFGKIWKL